MAEKSIEEISIDALKSKGEDLLNGLLVKYVAVAGRGETITDYCHVSLELRMMIRGRTAIEYPEGSPYVKCVKKVLPPGLRIALLSMKAGERALIWMDATLGFGNVPLTLESGLKRIRKNSDLVFEVFLKSWTESDVATNPSLKNGLTFECVPSINEGLERANSLMRTGSNIKALSILRGCLYRARRLRIDAEDQPAHEKVRNDLVFELTIRTAECALELGRYPLAVSLSREALLERPFNAHANYLCGCAYFALGILSSASRFLLSAHHNDISNEVYERKLRHLERHESLLDGDFADESDDLEEFEAYATNCLRKLIANERAMRADIQSYINLQLKLGVQSMSIGGGFRPVFLAGIADKIVKRNKQLRVEIRGDSLHLEF